MAHGFGMLWKPSGASHLHQKPQLEMRSSTERMGCHVMERGDLDPQSEGHHSGYVVIHGHQASGDIAGWLPAFGLYFA